MPGHHWPFAAALAALTSQSAAQDSVQAQLHQEQSATSIAVMTGIGRERGSVMRVGRAMSTALAALALASSLPSHIVDAQTLVKKDAAIHIYFKSAWPATKIQYQADGGDWSETPGVDMVSSTDSAFPAADGWVKYDAPKTATSLVFSFNDGGEDWDNNDEANYNVQSPGVYSIGSSESAKGIDDGEGTVAPVDVLGACGSFENACAGLSYPESTESRRWQTPPRNTSDWKPEYQDLRSLQGYAHVTYTSDRQSANVKVVTFTREAASCSYSFNGEDSDSETYTATSDLTDALQIVVSCTPKESSEKWTLSLDPVNFVWQNTVVEQPKGMEDGQRGAIVDMFGWPYKDIESECEDFLGKAGYMGVKINPPQETVLSDVWQKEGQRNPWYLVYQPVSYRLFSRLGSRDDLRSMIETCRANGVRVYADAVINHMAPGGNDVTSKHRSGSGESCSSWGAHSSAGGSPYYTHSFQYENNPYTGHRPAMEFPAVPFGPSDFHCERGIDDYTDAYQLANGWLVGLSDLDTSKTYVRERIAQFLVDLLGIGFSGVRIDALKHIHPADAAGIFGLLTKYMGGSLPADFISWGEVLLGGETEFLACDETNDYNYYKGLDNRYKAEGISDEDIAKLKIWSSDYPISFPACGSWLLPADRFVIQNDDHDQQAHGSSSRVMGDQGSVLIVDKDVDAHRSFEEKLFTRQDGDWKIKVVLSSYTFTEEGATGFPDGFSECGGSTGAECDFSMPYEKAFQAGSCGYTVHNFEGGHYTRVHRDLSIVNAMRGWVGLDTVSAADVGITGEC